MRGGTAVNDFHPILESAARKGFSGIFKPHPSFRALDRQMLGKIKAGKSFLVIHGKLMRLFAGYTPGLTRFFLPA